MKVVFDLGVTQAKTRWPGKLIKKKSKALWNKAYGLETANSKGIPPPFIETSVQPQHLTETKCEQIGTHKREITFAHFNRPYLLTAAK